MINQADLPTVSDAELAKLDAEMEQKGRELKSILDLIKEDEAKIKELESEPTDEQV